MDGSKIIMRAVTNSVMRPELSSSQMNDGDVGDVYIVVEVDVRSFLSFSWYKEKNP